MIAQRGLVSTSNSFIKRGVLFLSLSFLHFMLLMPVFFLLSFFERDLSGFGEDGIYFEGMDGGMERIG